MKEQQDALEILDQLKSELEKAGGFFSKKPDLDLCLDLCDDLARILPEYIKEASQVKERKKDILANADVVAKNTIRAAEEKANKIVSESEIVRAAQAASKQIIENAYAQCDNLILRTKAHLDNLFKDTENFLGSTLSVVRTNREELRAALTGGNKAG